MDRIENMDITQKIKHRLFNLVQKSNFTQRQICDEIKIQSDETLRNWLNTEKSYLPKVLELIALADLFDVTVEYIITGKKHTNGEIMQLKLDAALQRVKDLEQNIKSQKETIELMRADMRGDNIGEGIKKL